MSTDTIDGNKNFHASTLSSVDAKRSGFGGYNEIRPNLAFFNDILPAESVAVLFLDGSGDEEGVISFKAEILDYFTCIDHGGHAAFLVTAPRPQTTSSSSYPT